MDNDFFANASDFLQSQSTTMDLFDNNQYDFNIYLSFARQLSWDIDSALAHHCPKQPSWDCPNIMYQPDPNDPIDKSIIDHFKDIHGLDLLDTNINWSFDT